MSGDLVELRNTIAERMDDGASLDEVETELIEPQDDLDDEERAALWLFAWSFVPLARQRIEAIRLSSTVFDGHGPGHGASALT
jgi:hypothetical protein